MVMWEVCKDSVRCPAFWMLVGELLCKLTLRVCDLWVAVSCKKKWRSCTFVTLNIGRQVAVADERAATRRSFLLGDSDDTVNT